MGLCPPDVGLAALRTLRRQDLVASELDIEAAAVTSRVAPSRLNNVANTRLVRVVPRDKSVNEPDVVLDQAAAHPGNALPDVLDVRVAVAGLTKQQAFFDMNAVRTASRSGKLSREMAKTPGLDAGASVGHSTDDWFYNGHDLEGDPISPAALAAAIIVPTLAAAALATGAIAYAVRSRRRRRERDVKLAALASAGTGSGTGGGGSGGGKPSDLLKAIAAAAPVKGDPMARLATVDWELDPADLEVATTDDGAEVELGDGASGRVIKGRYRVTGQRAIKILKTDRLATAAGDGRALEDMAREILFLRSIRHPSIVSFVGASLRDGAPPILVVELMARGDLYRAIDNPRFAPVFKWERARDASGKVGERKGAG